MTIEVRRARPWLGTFVEIAATAPAEAAALDAIEGAFAEIGEIHRLMSFHSPDSDLGRMNREASEKPVRIDARTREVLAMALAMAAGSDGCFDPTIAPELVAWGLLPAPSRDIARRRRGSWRDIELMKDGSVRFQRPLWIDFGGIAKGYAVDRAIERMMGSGAVSATVNAGGDLRIAGARTETVQLRSPFASESALIEIRDGSVATSSAGLERRRVRGRWVGPHLDGRTRRATSTLRSASVAAERCAVADALTKVVLADGAGAEALLRSYGAVAWTFDSHRRWTAVCA